MRTHKRKEKEIIERIETFNPIEQAIKKKPEIPKIPDILEEQPRKKIIPCKMTEEELEMLNTRNEWIREQRNKASIQKTLRKMGQNKYSPLIGKKINIKGELYEVKPVDRKDRDQSGKPTSQ